MLTDSASVLKTEIVALSLFKRNWTGFLSQKLSCQQKEEFYCVCVKVCHSKLNSCSLAGLGLKLGFPVDPKEEQYFSMDTDVKKLLALVTRTIFYDIYLLCLFIQLRNKRVHTHK